MHHQEFVLILNCFLFSTRKQVFFHQSYKAPSQYAGFQKDQEFQVFLWRIDLKWCQNLFNVAKISSIICGVLLLLRWLEIELFRKSCHITKIISQLKPLFQVSVRKFKMRVETEARSCKGCFTYLLLQWKKKGNPNHFMQTAGSSNEKLKPDTMKTRCYRALTT